MKLLFKFNLVFLLVFALGLAATGYVSWTLLERNARDEIAQNARLLMDTALATRSYTATQVNPLLETQMKYTFLPQSVPAYSATEVFNDLRKKHSEYGYKEAVLNPTNPRFSLLIETWRRLPLPLANAISPFISCSLA